MSKLVLNKQDHEFFIAVCKTGEHSFLTFGAQDKTTKKNILLGSFGKFFDSDHTTSLAGAYINFLFNEVNACLVSELEVNEHREQKLLASRLAISYKAYSIHIENYRSFLAMLAKSKRFTDLNGLRAYQVVDEDATSLTFDFKRISKSEPVRNISLKADVDDFTGANTVSIGNTCRHSVMSLLEMVFGGRFYDSDMICNYSSYAKHFPYKNHIRKYFFKEDKKRHYVRDEMSDNLLIFPTPPSPYPRDAHDKSHLILQRIFKQLNVVTRKYLEDEVTHKKFNLMKELFNTVDSLKTKPLHELFDAIDKWAKENAAVIDQKRGFTLFNTTGTRAMVNSLQRMRDKLKIVKPSVGITLS